MMNMIELNETVLHKAGKTTYVRICELFVSQRTSEALTSDQIFHSVKSRVFLHGTIAFSNKTYKFNPHLTNIGSKAAHKYQQVTQIPKFTKNILLQHKYA